MHQSLDHSMARESKTLASHIHSGEYHSMIICVTGKYGSGKTTVSKLIGFKVINADYIGRKIFIRKKKEIKKLLGTLNRRKIREKVFSDRRILKRFNAIMHPEMIKLIKDEIKKNKGKNIVVDAALYHELELGKLCDKIIIVKRDKEKIAENMMIDKIEIEKIHKNQKTPTKFDFIINNNKDKKYLKTEVDKLSGKLK